MEEAVDICLESAFPSKKEEMLSPNLLFTKQLEHMDIHRHRQNYTPPPPLLPSRLELEVLTSHDGDCGHSGRASEGGSLKKNGQRSAYPLSRASLLASRHKFGAEFGANFESGDFFK